MLDLAILASFVACSLYIGWRWRWKGARDLEQYFLAGRSVSGWRAGLSMAATQFAADTPLLVMGLLAMGGVVLNTPIPTGKGLTSTPLVTIVGHSSWPHENRKPSIATVA